MASVLIDFDLPDFYDSFTWEGDANAARQAAEAARQLAARAGFDPPGEYPLRTLTQAPLLLNDPTTRGPTKAVIAAFVLQLPTQDADRPGVIGDYVAGHDIAVAIHQIRDRFICRVGFVPQKDLASATSWLRRGRRPSTRHYDHRHVPQGRDTVKGGENRC